MIINREWDVENWITVSEVAKRAKVSRKTVYNWLRKGHVRAVETAGGTTRIDPESLWKESHLVPQSKEGPEAPEGSNP